MRQPEKKWSEVKNKQKRKKLIDQRTRSIYNIKRIESKAHRSANQKSMQHIFTHIYEVWTKNINFSFFLNYKIQKKMCAQLSNLYDKVISKWRCPWCSRYHRRKWTRRHEFKSRMRLIAFHIALIPLGKVWIQLFSLQLWVNSRADWVLQPWWGN